MASYFTSYDLEYDGVRCVGVDWDNYEFKFLFRGKLFHYKQQGQISCSADTDHIRCVICEFKQDLMKKFFEENYH